MNSLEIYACTIFATMVLSTHGGPIRRTRSTDQMEHRYKTPCGGQRQVTIDVPLLRDNSTEREVTENFTSEIEPLLQELKQKFADLERKYLKLDGLGNKRYIHRLNRMVLSIIRQAEKTPLPLSRKKTNGTNKTQASRTLMPVSTNTNETHMSADHGTVNYHARGHVASIDRPHLHDELQVEKVYEATTVATDDADLQSSEIPVSIFTNAETELELAATEFDTEGTNVNQGTSVSNVTPSSNFPVTTPVPLNNTFTYNSTTKPSMITSSGNISPAVNQEALGETTESSGSRILSILQTIRTTTESILGDATVTEVGSGFASNSTENNIQTVTQNETSVTTIMPMDNFSTTTNSVVNAESKNETMSHVETSNQEDDEKHKVHVSRLWRLFRVMAAASLFTEQIRNYESTITESSTDNGGRVILNDILEIERHGTTGIERLLCKIKMELLAHGEEDVDDFHMDHTKIIPANFRRHNISRAKKIQRTYVMIASVHRLMDFLVTDVKNWHKN